jgi:hypothetical protein
VRTSATELIDISGEVAQQLCSDDQLRVVKIDRDAGESPGAVSHTGELALQPLGAFPAETRNALREKLE